MADGIYVHEKIADLSQQKILLPIFFAEGIYITRWQERSKGDQLISIYPKLNSVHRLQGSMMVLNWEWQLESLKGLGLWMESGMEIVS